ncbi:MAG: hypothetical protein KIT11_02620 [Fimbriimonadaceae bacterium]|nr:hypothetical protein [Fimbriimonadaceae bacterium]QYK54739.1 MAG: hypothetical protein KF733_06915 [Fimbriimonadaceae bacterium]
MREFVNMALEYDNWASARWLEALPDLRYREEAVPILGHMAQAMLGWARRIRGETPTLTQIPEGEIAAAIDRGTAELSALAASEDLDRVFEWTRMRDGSRHRHSVGAALFHVANHGTYHRGHLRGLAKRGDAFPETDVSIWWPKGDGKAPEPGWWTRMADYHCWASDAWAGVPLKELARVQAHDYGAFQGWLAGIAVQSRRPQRLPREMPPEWAELSSRTWVEVVQSLPHDASYTWRRVAKPALSWPVWVLSWHVFNHGTYHRGQLRGLCQRHQVDEFPDTDFVLWPGSTGVG